MESGNVHVPLCIDIRVDGCVGLPSGVKSAGCGLCVGVQGLKAVTHMLFWSYFGVHIRVERCCA